MATIYFLGTATAVAQVDTVQITADDAATTYTLTIGSGNNTAAVSVAGTGTGVNDTAAALQAAAAASTHPYFAAITFTVGTDTITMTAATAGVPFTAASSVAGGTGTIGAVANSTASAGPNDWSTAANWSAGAVPVADDDVILQDCSTNICWGLAQSAVDLDSLEIRRTYTGRIGLNYRAFATSADGATTDADALEYRATYLDIESDRVEIGAHSGVGSPTGSSRINLDLGDHACTCIVYATNTTSADTGRAPVRLLFNNAASILHVLDAAGGVGIAADAPGEVSTLGTVYMTPVSGSARLEISAGVTWTTMYHSSGTSYVSAANSPTTIHMDGGVLYTRGQWTFTTGNMRGGTWYHENAPAAGAAVTTLNLYAGTTIADQASEARTWTTVNFHPDAKLQADGRILTITTPTPPSERYTLSCK